MNGSLRARTIVLMVVLLGTLTPALTAQSRLFDTVGNDPANSNASGDSSGTGTPAANDTASGQSSPAAPAPEASVVPPKGFGSIELGMSLEEARSSLKGDSNFLFRGDPDVTMLTVPNETLIETKGAGFIDRGYFQFYDHRLYTIILELDTSRMDHYTMYTTLVARYGEPTSLDPQQAVWEFDGLRLSLERPLRVKYIDTVVFDSIVAAQKRGESLTRMSRDRFLNQF